MPFASIIIVNYNSGNRLQRCLDCLRRQTFNDFEVIVVDNGSHDNSIALASEGLTPHTLIEAGQNLGFAAANNRAASVASSEWLVFLNPDAYAETSWLQELHSATKRYLDIDAFGSAQLDEKNPDRIDGAGDIMHAFGVPYRRYFGRKSEYLPPDGDCFSPCAAAAMYRRRIFDALGGFDERFFCYGEDVDLGFRLQLSGGKALQLRAARVLHEGSGVTGRHSAFTVYHGHRNRIWLTYKNFPAEIYWLTMPARLMIDILLGLRALLGGYFDSYWSAIKDGYGGLARFSGDRKMLADSRKISVGGVARRLAWSPMRLIGRN